VFIDRAPGTKLHKREQKDRTKTLAEFPNHVLKDYMIRSVSNTGKKYGFFLSTKKDTGEKQI
jgi:hypothetical protein